MISKKHDPFSLNDFCNWRGKMAWFVLTDASGPVFCFGSYYALWYFIVTMFIPKTEDVNLFYKPTIIIMKIQWHRNKLLHAIQIISDEQKQNVPQKRNLILISHYSIRLHGSNGHLQTRIHYVMLRHISKLFCFEETSLLHTIVINPRSTTGISSTSLIWASSFTITLALRGFIDRS